MTAEYISQSPYILGSNMLSSNFPFLAAHNIDPFLIRSWQLDQAADSSPPF